MPSNKAFRSDIVDELLRNLVRGSAASSSSRKKKTSRATSTKRSKSASSSRKNASAKSKKRKAPATKRKAAPKKRTTSKKTAKPASQVRRKSKAANKRARLTAQVIEGLLSGSQAEAADSGAEASSPEASPAASSSSASKASLKWEALDRNRRLEINRAFGQFVRNPTLRHVHLKRALRLRKRTALLLSRNNYNLACYLMRHKRSAQIAAADSPEAIEKIKADFLQQKRQLRSIRADFTDDQLTISPKQTLFVEKLLARSTATKPFYPAKPKTISQYIYFHGRHRDALKAENPEASFGQVGKLVGTRWRDQTEAEKLALKPLYEAALRDHEIKREQFDAAVISYVDSDPEDPPAAA